MARKAQLLLAEDRQNAADATYSTDATEITELGDTDAEQAWNDWQEALRNAESGGIIHAHRLPTDADGNPVQGKGMRLSHLGSWDHQLYTFEELVEKIRREFVKAGERSHIKLTGMVKGKRGTMFSQIVTIERAAAAESSGESVTQIFRLMQEGQERNAQMLREIIQPAVAAPPASRPFAETAKEFTAILAPIVGPILAAWISRPARPKSDLAELVGAMSQMRDFIQGKSDEHDDSDSGTLATIVKAVAPALPDLAKIFATAPGPREIPMAAPRAAISAPVDRSTIPASVARQLPPQAQTINPAPSVAGESQPGVTNEMLLQIKPHLEELATLAEEKQDPKEVAKLLISMLPDSVLEILDNLVQDEKNFARLAMLTPKVKLHAEWFEQLRQAIDAELTEGSDTDRATG